MECPECQSTELEYPVSDSLNFICSNCGWNSATGRVNYQDRTPLMEQYEAVAEMERDRIMGPAPDAESEAYAATIESMKDEHDYAREQELDAWATEQSSTNHPFADY